MLRDTEAVASLFGVTIMEMVYLYGTASIVAQVPNGKWFILGRSIFFQALAQLLGLISRP